jgi:hypothetical protein
MDENREPVRGRKDKGFSLSTVLFPAGDLGMQFPADLQAFCEATNLDLLPDGEDVLYHYTDARGLIGIINDGCLWATAAAYLNDRREIVHGLDVIRETLEGLTNPEPIRLIREVYKATINALSTLSALDFYVCALSRSADVKSQWVDYAARGYGYAVGMDRLGMVDLEPTPIPFPVIYDNEVQRNLTRSLMVGLSDRIKKRLISGADEFISDDERERLASDIGSALAAYAHVLIPGLKHQGFAEEKEFRWILPFGVSALTPEKTYFRDRSGVIVPYVKMNGANGKGLPIREIVVGPMLDFEKASNSVKMMLKANGYEDVRVWQSAIPLT